MVDNVVRYYMGYIQIHKQGFWDDQTLENSFEAQAIPAALKEKENIAPRLESFAPGLFRHYHQRGIGSGY